MILATASIFVNRAFEGTWRVRSARTPSGSIWFQSMAWASEIGGVPGYKRSIEILGLGPRSGNTGLRSPAWSPWLDPLGLGRRGWFADVGRWAAFAGRRRSAWITWPGLTPFPLY